MMTASVLLNEPNLVINLHPKPGEWKWSISSFDINSIVESRNRSNRFDLSLLLLKFYSSVWILNAINSNMLQVLMLCTKHQLFSSKTLMFILCLKHKILLIGTCILHSAEHEVKLGCVKERLAMHWRCKFLSHWPPCLIHANNTCHLAFH